MCGKIVPTCALLKTVPDPVSALLRRAPVAIGVAAMSTSEMLTSGLKGRGFSVLHTYQDHLWWVQYFSSVLWKAVWVERAWGLDSEMRVLVPAVSLRQH